MQKTKNRHHHLSYILSFDPLKCILFTQGVQRHLYFRYPARPQSKADKQFGHGWAELVEQLHLKQEIHGSNPVAGNYFIYPRNVLDYVVLQGRRDRFNK